MPALTHGRVKNGFNGGRQRKEGKSTRLRVNHALANKNLQSALPSAIGRSNNIKRVIETKTICCPKNN